MHDDVILDLSRITAVVLRQSLSFRINSFSGSVEEGHCLKMG